jgi:hypothetical protein
MRVRSFPLLTALTALTCACTVTTVDRRPVVYRPAPPPPPDAPPPPVVYREPAPPPPVVYQEPAPPPPVVYESRALYRYFGPHHIPDSIGGGWCVIDGVHEHDFPPENPGWYRFERGVYHYSAPIVITFYDAHPDNHGGWCSLHGPHRHDYYPPRDIHASFVYDRDRHHYFYRGHSAAPALGEPGHRRDEVEHHRWSEPERHPSIEPDRHHGEPEHRQGEASWRRDEAHPSAPARSEVGLPRRPVPPSVSHDPPPGRAPRLIGSPDTSSPGPHPIIQKPHPSAPGQVGPSAPGHASAPGSPGPGIGGVLPGARMGASDHSSAPGSPSASGGAAPPGPHSIRPGEAARPQSPKPDDSKRHRPGSPR